MARVEREKRAVVLTSEGGRDAVINTAEGIQKVAQSIQVAGGYEVVQLRVAEQYIKEFGELTKASNTLILPASVSDVGSMIALAMNVMHQKPGTTLSRS